MTATIYHNPRCSKSLAALSLLEENGVNPKIVEYLKTPPSRQEIYRMLDALGVEPRELMRKKEDPYAALDLANNGKSCEELIDAIIENPILLERPIVVMDGKYAIGRPPENVLEIL
jgi:arsenate reductase